MFSIKNLNETPQYIEQIAEWHQSEWGYLNLNKTIIDRIAWLKSHLNDERLSTTLVADCGGYVIGSASLVKSDMDTRKALSPWLASVYVQENHRGMGVGEVLVDSIVRLARKTQFGSLYLFTPSKASFYAKRGWAVFSEEVYRETNVTIMRIGLKSE